MQKGIGRIRRRKGELEGKEGGMSGRLVRICRWGGLSILYALVLYFFSFKSPTYMSYFSFFPTTLFCFDCGVSFEQLLGWLGTVDPILSYRTAQNLY